MLRNIAVDTMGGDNAPREIVKGCIAALSEYPDIHLSLVGHMPTLERELSGLSYDVKRLTLIHASEIIGNDEHPTHAVRKKKDSSLVVSMRLVKDGQADAVVSAGSTGALLTCALSLIGRIRGIGRPAIATLIPNTKGSTLLIDSGANVDCKPEYLQQFAVMGSIYMENVLGIKSPRVGLINIGAEKEKGDSLTIAAHELLENSGLNFVGNLEARDMPLGAADVAVCDGFVGNIILKYSEGFAKMLLSLIKTELMSSLPSKIGALLSKSAYKRLKASFDPSNVGGAAFLGLNGLVAKAHGSSDAKAIKNAINQCRLFIDCDIVNKITSKLGNAEKAEADPNE